MDSLL